VATFERSRDPFRISTDPALLDPAAIRDFLSRSYWAEGISHDLVVRSLTGSLCFGLYDAGRQIGLARIITDRATFAYLCDVYVLEEYRGQGLGKWLMASVMAHPDLGGLRRFSLVTRDAHTQYAALGFTPLAQPDRHMEIVLPGLYLSAGTSRDVGGGRD
jgi:GNAT superfamily N-acetyltransferase